MQALILGDSMMSFQTDWLVSDLVCPYYYWKQAMVWFDLATKARNQSGRRTLRFHTKVVLSWRSSDPSLWDSD